MDAGEGIRSAANIPPCPAVASTSAEALIAVTSFGDPKGRTVFIAALPILEHLH